MPPPLSWATALSPHRERPTEGYRERERPRESQERREPREVQERREPREKESLESLRGKMVTHVGLSQKQERGEKEKGLSEPQRSELRNALAGVLKKENSPPAVSGVEPRQEEQVPRPAAQTQSTSTPPAPAPASTSPRKEIPEEKLRNMLEVDGEK